MKALKHVVANIAGLEGQCGGVQLKKLAEGATNKVMTATVGRRRFIVKVPDPLVPRRFITASEVATLEFLRAELELPVPKVLAWSDNNDNTVGCEYIVMEEAAGQDLKSKWSALGIKQRMVVVDQIIAIQERLLEASKNFHGYGSLYFTEDAVKFSFRRQIEVSATKSSKFCIGPLAHEHFMESAMWKSGINSGPCEFPFIWAIFSGLISLKGIPHTIISIPLHDRLCCRLVVVLAKEYLWPAVDHFLFQ